MNSASNLALEITEQYQVPDAVIRRDTPFLIKQRMKETQSSDVELLAEIQTKFFECLNESPIDLMPDKANEQHYEVTAEFYLKTIRMAVYYLNRTISVFFSQTKNVKDYRSSPAI